MNDIILNKKESVERCVKQIRVYYALPGDKSFEDNYLKQDAIGLNLQRACQQTIDLANHIIKTQKLGLPKTAKDSFKMLADNKIISRELAVDLGKMVSFRNILIHEYQKLDIKLMVEVIEKHSDNLLDFTDIIMEFGREVKKG